jgi:tRNA A-37 threonylcarbamoyl transferase component Bud32
MNPDFEEEVMIRYGVREANSPDEVLAQYDQLVGAIPARYIFGELIPDISVLALVVTTVQLLSIYFQAVFLFTGFIAVAISLFTGLAAFMAFGALIALYARSFSPKYLFTATDVGISAAGIRLHRRNLHLGHAEEFIAWEDCSDIHLTQTEMKDDKNRTDSVLEIVGVKEHFRLKMSLITTIEERLLLHDALKKYGRRAIGSEDISPIIRMGVGNEVPFTQLWSQALADKRPRIRTSLLKPNTTLQSGTFTIKEHIGGGGQGTVYLAEMLEGGELPRVVVLKEYVLPEREHVGDYKKAVELFEKEVNLMSKLREARIAQLIDAFVEDHRSYLVLDHIDGPSLKQRVNEDGPVSIDQAVQMGIQMCQLLLQLHTMSPPVMHLDFSPENILLAADGELVLIDFNISIEQDAVRTRTVMGKQHYMAPEQYRGKPTTASDIYALGQIPDFHEEFRKCIAKATALEECDRYEQVSDVLLVLEEIRNNLEKTPPELPLKENQLI